MLSDRAAKKSCVGWKGSCKADDVLRPLEALPLHLQPKPFDVCCILGPETPHQLLGLHGNHGSLNPFLLQNFLCNLPA